MHLIAIDSGSRVVLSTQLVVAHPWSAPRLRLQLSTDTDRGVILDFDADTLRLLASCTRTLLANYRAATRRCARPVSRPTPQALAFYP